MCPMCNDTGLVIYERELLPGVFGDVGSGCMLCKREAFSGIVQMLEEERIEKE